MNDPMTLLKNDHRDAKRLLRELAESDPGKKRQKMVDEVTKALLLHMEIEEQLVYPLVEDHEGGDVRQEADNEHGLARNGIITMGEMVDTPGFGAAVQSLLGGITHHVKEEENEILPALKAKMDTAAWKALGEEMAEMKRVGTKASLASR